MQPAATHPSAPHAKALARIHISIEALWLLALVVVPLIVLPERAMTFIESSKIAVFRLIAVALVGLMVWERALTRRTATPRPRLDVWLKQDPSHWVIAAALAVLGVTLLSAALSPMPSVSFLGKEHGRDSASLYSIATYVIFFLAIATHLRRMQQLRRILLAVTGAAVVASIYAIGQHFEFDPIRSDPFTDVRAGASFGNSIFFGAFLVLAIPLSFAALVQATTKLPLLLRSLVVIIPLAAESVGLMFTLSRGPWIGMIAGLLAFGAIAAFHLPRRVTAVIAVGTVAAGVAALLFSTIPNKYTNVPDGSSVTARAGTIVEGITSQGLSGRTKIWQGSATIAAHHPWPDADLYPELPDLSVRPLRYLVGYGPDMFLFTYPLAAQPQLESIRHYNAHNFLFNTAAEQGALGLAAIAGMAVALLAVALHCLRHIRRGARSVEMAILLAALVAALAGRFVEQLTGIAQISDSMLFWAIAAMLAALPALLRDDKAPVPVVQPEPPVAAPPTSRLPSFSVCIALVVTAGLLALVWFGNVRYVVASALGAQAGRAFDSGRGDLDRSLAKLDQAISWAPDVQAYRLNKSIVLNAKADRAPNADDRLQLLSRAQDVISRGLRNNPMEQLLWAKKAEYIQSMDEITGTLGQSELRAYQVLSALLPGYWIVHNPEASAHLRLEQPEQALGPIADSLAITGADSPLASRALYLRGVALRDLNRLPEAAQSLEQSLKVNPESGHAEDTYRILSEAYLNLNQRDRAFQSRAQYSYFLALRLLTQNSATDAAAALQQSLFLDPNGPRSSAARALLAKLQSPATPSSTSPSGY